MNKFPTIFISFKNICGRNFSHSYDIFLNSISEIFLDNEYLLHSEKIHDKHKAKIQAFIDEKVKQSDTEDSLLFLCKMLNKYWDKKVIILIDEYDVPLFYSEQRGFYDEMLDFIRQLLGGALKGNNYLEFAVITGCLRIVKESIFTGVNNFECCGVSDIKFSDKIGFTNNDVDLLLKINKLENNKDIIKEWYDGYKFGNINNIYCPWDVLQYIVKLKRDQKAFPETYWLNSSSNDIIKKMIESSTTKTRQKNRKAYQLRIYKSQSF
jgi:hypothetical protein